MLGDGPLLCVRLKAMRMVLRSVGFHILDVVPALFDYSTELVTCHPKGRPFLSLETFFGRNYSASHYIVKDDSSLRSASM